MNRANVNRPSRERPKAETGDGTRGYQYRACCQDEESTPEYFLADNPNEAKNIIAFEMKNADPPYDTGWIERRPIGPWERVDG